MTIVLYIYPDGLFDHRKVVGKKFLTQEMRKL